MREAILRTEAVLRSEVVLRSGDVLLDPKTGASYRTEGEGLRMEFFSPDPAADPTYLLPSDAAYHVATGALRVVHTSPKESDR
ncbi:MAG: hypothetical protein ACRCSN_19735 [Dermatophilaceae bacterium]